MLWLREGKSAISEVIIFLLVHIVYHYKNQEHANKKNDSIRQMTDELVYFTSR